MFKRKARDTRAILLPLISALGILNGGTALAQIFLYVTGDNRQKLPLLLVNIVVFIVSLVYVPIRQQSLKRTHEVKDSRVCAHRVAPF